MPVSGEVSGAGWATRLRRLAPYFLGAKGPWAIATLATIVAAATEPLIPALLKPLLDQGFTGPGFPLWLVPLCLILLFGVRGLAGFLAQVSLTHVAGVGMVALRRALFDHLLRAHGSLFTLNSASTLANTLVYEVQTGATQLVHSLLSLARDSLTLLALVGYLFILNWQLTLIVAVLFPAVALVMRVLSRRLYRLTKASQDSTDRLAYAVEENVLAQRVVRLHGAQADQAARFEALSQHLRQLSLKATLASAAMTPATQMLAAVALSAVLTLALWQSGGQAITVGGFVSFVTAMLMLVAPIKHLSEVANPITRSLAALERGLDLMAQTPLEEGGSFVSERTSGAISYQNVSVRYANDERASLDRLTLDVAPGEVVALVGPSGAGKTTLVNALTRFVEVSEGQIQLDGVDVRQWQLRALRAQFALVSQDVVMLNASLAANVALGTPVDGIDRTRVLACLEAARLGELVAGLPDGIDAVLGHNAAQLSGGQRQRLAIARALYKNAPILLLDEATSALDNTTERLVQDALRDLMRGRTTLVVAHRLSTIESADRIVVLDRGQIVESGRHADLLAAGGLYAHLHRGALAPATAPAPSVPGPAP